MRRDTEVVPSPAVVALVRHSDPDVAPPHELLPYVVATHRDGVLFDWLLTDDAIAFGDVSILRQFQEWRQQWERSWVLDSSSSLVRLIAIARRCEPSAGDWSSNLERLSANDDGAIAADALGAVVDDLELLRDAIRDSGAEGFGFVDATEGSERVGLVRSWSPSAGPEILAANQHLEVTMHPESGLGVEVFHDSGELRASLEHVHTVELGDDHVLMQGVHSSLRLSFDEARPLFWVVPGAQRWRVRRVPSVLVWARTFAGLAEAARFADVYGLPLRLTTTPPVA